MLYCKPLHEDVKIGVDAVPLNRPSGGIGYFIFYLLESLIPLHPNWTFFLYTLSMQGDITHFKKYPNVVIRPLPFLQASHSLWSQTTLTYRICKDNIEIFLGTTQSIPLIGRKRLKNILLLYDFAFHYFPHTVSPLKCLFLKLFTRAMVNRADYIVSISQGTADKLFSLYNERSNLILHPPLKNTIQFKSKECVETFLPPFGLNYKQYFFTIGTIEPRKNFIGLVNSYLNLLRTHNTLYPLAIAGEGGWKNKEITEKLQQAQREFPDKIKLLGRVGDEALSHLLSGARYYLCFSLYEGYGMPLAEARYCRTPVICFDQPELREASENDGIFLPSHGFEEMFAHYLLLQNPPLPSTTHYISNQEKARALSYALLDLLNQ